MQQTWTTLLVAKKQKQVVTTPNDWCNFGDIHCSKQVMTTHDPLYMIVLQALQSWPDAFCRFWLLFLSTRSFWVSLTRKAEEMQSISWMTLFGILLHVLLKKLTLLMNIVLKKMQFFKELLRADSLQFPQNYIACGDLGNDIRNK